MAQVPDNFVELRNVDTGATWLGPVTYAEHNPAWRPVDDTVHVPSVADGKVDDVLAAVGDDPALAQTALDAEKASPKPRTTLVDRLSTIANPTS